MNSKLSYPEANDDSYLVSSILGQDLYSSSRSLEGVESRIAERKRLEYRNVVFLERQRQKLEESLNVMSCFGYSPKSMMVRSRLEAEMIRVEMRKAEEVVTSFRDVERLEYQKRKLVEDLEGQRSTAGLSSGGQSGSY